LVIVSDKGGAGPEKRAQGATPLANTVKIERGEIGEVACGPLLSR